MVVFCSLFQSNTLNQLARTAHNNQVADICFENAGFHAGLGRGGSIIYGGRRVGGWGAGWQFFSARDFFTCRLRKMFFLEPQARVRILLCIKNHNASGMRLLHPPPPPPTPPPWLPLHIFFSRLFCAGVFFGNCPLVVFFFRSAFAL